ncbi:MAG TPA: prepilin-type N-terminal cleavage/methylation domain-containing protein [Steroidobacteraceae bacterium]|jgi:MSHA pilin protein MshD
MSIKPSRGVTLVELVVFMVVIGIALAMFASFNTIVAGSPNPEVRKQALAIAESLLEEVELMAFTYCDANDANAATATSSGGCALASNSEDGAPLGPKTIPVLGAETRYSTTVPFNNAMHYNGFSMGPGIFDITSGGVTQVTGLGAYSASIVVTQVNLASAGDQIASPEALNIAVTVTGPGSVSITLEGYRTRYAPNTTP